MLRAPRLMSSPIQDDRCGTIQCPCCWQAPWPTFGRGKSPSGSRFQCAEAKGTDVPAALGCWDAATTSSREATLAKEPASVEPQAEKCRREIRMLASGAFSSLEVHGLRRHIQTRNPVACGVALAREPSEHRQLLHIVKERIKYRHSKQ